MAAALGLAATRRGKRVILCEVGEQERLTALFGPAPEDAAERELAPGLFGADGRSRAHEGGVAPLPAALGHARRAARRQPRVPVPHGGGAGPDRARDDGQDLGPRAARAADRGGGLRPRDRGRARHGTRPGDAERPVHLRGRGAGGPDPPPGAHHRRVRARRRYHRGAGRLAAGGDPGERDDRPRGQAPRRAGHRARRRRGERDAPEALHGRGRPPARGPRRPRVRRGARRRPRRAVRGAPGPRRARAGRPPRRASSAPVLTLPFVFEPDLGREELERLARVLERRL